jgi:short-subunit dehydrogenase
MHISGKTVVLTGASGGIGRALAEKLGAAGAHLILVARDGQKLNKLRDDLGGHPHMVVAADLGEIEGRHQLRDVCTHAGVDGISLLINSVGVNDFSLLEEQSQEAISNLINVNLLSPILVCQDLLPLLVQGGGGQIINIGSTFGSIGYPGFAAYCASKFGLRGFTESLRRELADSDVKVSYVAPRATTTELNSDEIVEMNGVLGTAMDDPSLVADEVMKIVGVSTRSNRYIGWPEKVFVRVNALFPGLVDKGLRKQLPIIQHYARQGSERRMK